MKKGLFVLFVICTVFLCMGDMDVYASNTVALPFTGEWVTQTMTEDGDAGMLRWQIVVPSDGRVDVAFQSFRNSTYWYLYDQDEANSFFRGQINNASKNSPVTQEKSWYLTKGIYNFVIGDNLSNAYGGDGDIRMKAMYTPANTTEIEPNDTWGNAMFLSIDTKVRGILTERVDREDFYRIQITEKGEYDFKLVGMFSSCRMDIYDKDYQHINDMVLWDGSEKSPSNKTLRQELESGTYYLKITDNFANADPSGIYELTYSRETFDLSSVNAVLTLKETTYYCTGEAVTPDVSVNYKGTKLKENTDYTLVYANNKKVGTAIITVIGKGKYIGQKAISFEIVFDTDKIYTVGNLNYQVTAPSGGYAHVVGVSSADKTALKIPSTVKILGNTCKVNRIRAQAFQNNSTIKKLVIGVNVEKIDAKAFKGCPELAKIQVKSKVLNQVGKNALKGTKKKVQIILPKKYYAKYKKLFRKKGQPKIIFKKK